MAVFYKLNPRAAPRMEMIDVPEKSRVDRNPDGAATILEGSYAMHGATITRIELRRYVERRDDHGAYSLITACVHTSEHSIEMIYDEGYRGEDALERAAEFLVSAAGVSGLVLRALIAMQED